MARFVALHQYASDGRDSVTWHGPARLNANHYDLQLRYATCEAIKFGYQSAWFDRFDQPTNGR